MSRLNMDRDFLLDVSDYWYFLKLHKLTALYQTEINSHAVLGKSGRELPKSTAAAQVSSRYSRTPDPVENSGNLSSLEVRQR